MLQVAGKSIDFLVDTGATYSVLPSFRGTLCPSRVLVMGVNGQTFQPLETKPLNCQLDNCLFTHSFLVIPSCLTPLLGRDILTKFKTTFHLAPGSCPSTGRFLLLLTGSSSSQIDPQVWDIKIPTIAQHHPQVLIHLKGFLAQAQFPLSQPNLRGLKPTIDHLLGQGLLVPTSSLCNTPFLPVHKASGAYRLVQDLRLINKAVGPAHLLVLNPYTLLSQICMGTIHFTVINLKDAFFSILIHPTVNFCLPSPGLILTPDRPLSSRGRSCLRGFKIALIISARPWPRTWPSALLALVPCSNM